MTKNKKVLIADLGILFIALTWGLNFSVMKGALSDITPLYYLGIRFIIAAVFMLIVFNKNIRNISARDFKAGIIIGIFLATCFSVQVIGLQFTTPGKAGFIANASVVIVPFIEWIIYKKSPGTLTIIGALAAFVGLGLLSLTSSFTIQWGDGLMFLSALLFSGQVMAVSIFAPDADPLALAAVEIAFTGIVCIICAFIFEPFPSMGITTGVWGAILYGVIICTIAAFIIQGKSQQITPPSHAAILFCFESVFSLLFSILFGYEHMTLRSALGSVLIFAGFLLSEVKIGDKGKKDEVHEIA